MSNVLGIIDVECLDSDADGLLEICEGLACFWSPTDSSGSACIDDGCEGFGNGSIMTNESTEEIAKTKKGAEGFLGFREWDGKELLGALGIMAETFSIRYVPEE